MCLSKYTHSSVEPEKQAQFTLFEGIYSTIPSSCPAPPPLHSGLNSVQTPPSPSRCVSGPDRVTQHR